MRDDVDYVPTRGPVLMGHHFASIAGVGPIIGPIVASAFGWLPVFLWVVIGGVFIGAVHDFQALMVSIRHRSKTISEVLKENVGISSKKLFAAFVWLTIVLIIAVFANVIAIAFVATPAAATAAILFMVLAILFGQAVYRRGVSLRVATPIGVALFAACIWLGILFPLELPRTAWVVILLGYSYMAASLPVWFLLQPRDYLESFMLYGMLAAAFIGILVTNPTIQLPAFTAFEVPIGYLFPILFVTVACGAISGFHSIVSSGTTSKQLSSEAHAKPISYGGMLIEGILAVIALTAVAVLALGDRAALIAAVGPVGAFARGVGGFLTGLGIPLDVGITLTTLVVASFALTTLDTATRLCRFSFQELTEKEEGKPSTIVEIVTNRWVAGAIGVVFAAVLALTGVFGLIWPIFGSANQLLASLALLAGAVWLAKLGKSNWFLLYPMIFMLVTALSALVFLFFRSLAAGHTLLVIISVVLFVLAIVLVYLAISRLVTERKKVPGK
ncbi:MAG: Carbon starvation protein A [Chloroflexi bacterium]|nr:Carbon starvation protein A [Chloroflexota bacterium]